MKVYWLFLLFLVVIGKNQFSRHQYKFGEFAKKNERNAISKLIISKAPMNMIDFLAIVPFYLSLLLEGLEDFEIIGKAGKIIRLVKVAVGGKIKNNCWTLMGQKMHIFASQVMRILRVYRLVRHFAGLQSLFFTLQQAFSIFWYNIETKMVWCHWNIGIHSPLVLRLTKSLDFSSYWLQWQF